MKKNRLMEGAIIATLAIVISKILGILYVIPFYQIIGDKGGALYGYAYNIYNLFLVISAAGIPLAISKLTSEYETKKEFTKKEEMFKLAQKIIVIFAISSFLICFLFAKQIAILILGNLTNGNSIEDVTTVIKAISFALLVVPLLSIFRGYLQGHKYIAASSFSQVVEQLVRISIILIGSFITIHLLHLPVVFAVSLSVFAACIGAVIGYIYLFFKAKKSNILTKVNSQEIKQEEKKEIISKLIGYCIPFIIVNIANSLYNTTDMILILRGLDILGYPDLDSEIISSIFTTWGEKLGSIIKAVALGLTTSLIPSIVSAFVKKEQTEVNTYFNKIFLVLFFIILPIACFASLFSTEIWSVFYGESYYGPIIFRYTSILVVFDSAYLLVGSALQGLYMNKLIYKSVITGLLINLILDLPLMLLFNHLGIYPYYGAITATIIGYLFSLSIPLITLYKNHKFSYKETIKALPQLVISLLVFISICSIYKKVMPTPNNLVSTLFYIGTIGLISIAVYIIMNKKLLIKILDIKKKGENNAIYNN